VVKILSSAAEAVSMNPSNRGVYGAAAPEDLYPVSPLQLQFAPDATIGDPSTEGCRKSLLFNGLYDDRVQKPGRTYGGWGIVPRFWETAVGHCARVGTVVTGMQLQTAGDVSHRDRGVLQTYTPWHCSRVLFCFCSATAEKWLQA